MKRQPKVDWDNVAEDVIKKCPKCKIDKLAFKDFYLIKRPEGRRPNSWCKQCSKASAIEWEKKNPERAYKNARNSYDKILYGLKPGERDSLLETQKGLCAICNGLPEKGQGNILHLDHDHETGKNRGLLCHHCNTSLGGFKHDPALLRMAADYLEQYK